MSYEVEIRELEIRLAGQGRSDWANKITFYGSSSIRMWQSAEEDLGQAEILNLGFGGSTIKACVEHFDKLVTPHTPTSILIYAGDNDIGDGSTPDEILANFIEIKRLVRERFGDIPFGFVSLKPSLSRKSYLPLIKETNERIASTFNGNPKESFIDIFSDMMVSEDQPDPSLFVEDGLHMNENGYAVWIEKVSPVIASWS